MEKSKLSQKNILVVEDDPALQEAIVLKLKKMGLSVSPFRTAEEALVYLKTDKPDLAWLDILLPGMNGIEFLGEIRKNKNLVDLPVIMVTVSASDEKKNAAFKMKALDFIVKSEKGIDEIVRRAIRFIAA